LRKFHSAADFNNVILAWLLHVSLSKTLDRPNGLLIKLLLGDDPPPKALLDLTKMRWSELQLAQDQHHILSGRYAPETWKFVFDRINRFLNPPQTHEENTTEAIRCSQVLEWPELINPQNHPQLNINQSDFKTWIKDGTELIYEDNNPTQFEIRCMNPISIEIISPDKESIIRIIKDAYPQIENLSITIIK
jgi:hypothetical protein